MEKLIEKLQSLKDKQKGYMIAMSKEKFDDINSILRVKGYAEIIIELEVRIETLKDAIVAIA
jgi:hypothetical protein